MDVNEYMKKSLELQERTATALEAVRWRAACTGRREQRR